MITSMTGFGRGEAAEDGYQVTVELKSLNSRYLDISLKLPAHVQSKEFDLKSMVQDSMSRGKLLVNVNVDLSGSGIPSVRYRPELVKTYSKMLEEIRFHAGLTKPPTLADLLTFQDLWIPQEPESVNTELIWRCLQGAMREALENLQQMRQKEGQELRRDLMVQIEGIGMLVDKVEKLAEKRLPEVRERFRARLNKWMQDSTWDPSRMEMEIVLLADKMDVNEEIVRLKSHIKFFLEALDASEAVGRRLNFLCQEINRELNTIGSKAGDSEIAQDMVIAKEKLEQIREQVQNIE